MHTHTTSRQTGQFFKLWGTVARIMPNAIGVSGVSRLTSIGNEIEVISSGRHISGEVVSVSERETMALLHASADDIRLGDRVYVQQDATVGVSDAWLGQIVNYKGLINGHSAAPSSKGQARKLLGPPPATETRRALGARLNTGLMVTDTLLPLCKGQRIGLFAGSGVGKSTLLSTLANRVQADRVVVALIGERSREVSEFALRTLTQALRHKATIIAATSSESPGAKKRAAYCAMAAAEHFRDQGEDVLLIFDSLTRFAEAHREIALLSGEQPGLHAYPPSTNRVIAELTERAGPGAAGMGDITAIFSVLVAGSDMEEPVADMIRGILDGHIVLSRQIAERARYPAIDISRSVSRSLPNAASDTENELLRSYRYLTALHEEVAPMLRANLYEFGQDPETDRAIKLHSVLDQFISRTNPGDIAAAFESLKDSLSNDVKDEAEAVS